jgi:hypothetical protein
VFDFFICLSILFIGIYEYIYVGETMAQVAVAVRCLRAFRPLRLAKSRALHTTANSLFSSLADLGYISLVDLLFIFIFGILCTQLYLGKMGTCSVEGFNKVDCLRVGHKWDLP